MTPRCSVFVAISLDGFIARSDGSIDWLQALNKSVPADEDCGYAAFMSDVDVLVMGRRTFEQVLGFDDWPYGATPVVVMSSGGVSIPAGIADRVSATRESPRALAERLGAGRAKHLYIDGGLTVQSFLAEGLIDDFTITVVPILLGEGKPLFGKLPGDVRLEHVKTHAYAFGYVQHVYRVTRTS